MVLPVVRRMLPAEDGLWAGIRGASDTGLAGAAWETFVRHLGLYLSDNTSLVRCDLAALKRIDTAPRTVAAVDVVSRVVGFSAGRGDR